ncbi:hypothetical protein [Candidatus Portiera aleyrodidarum]|uniref:hypothetical protein n=1 Tax=Candidatus Portiera aleyrodidarum TaxID=91844 RepID=UPI00155A99CA|nr:hypothetical protein [Candidatus Portiera aleyrodidarum]
MLDVSICVIMWTVDCGLWTVDCGLWTVDCGLWTVDCAMNWCLVFAVYVLAG